MSKIVPQFSKNAQTVLCKRYLKERPDSSECPHCGEIHESSEEMLERISYGNEDYYNLLASLDFLPNSPTLFNAGKETPGTSSGCFKFDVEDTMEGILETGRKAGMVQKWGGGVGYCLSALRKKDAHIASTYGKACGPVAVLKFYQAVALLITQGGRREGAQMGILHCEHSDIEEFISCKENDPQALSTFNISVACTDEFMRQASCEDTRQSYLFQKIAENAHKTGDPGIYFIDTAEAANPTPHLGQLTGTNPCGEVPLLDNEPCNLGSINLSHFVLEGNVDWERLRSVATLCVDYLDETLSRNFFPEPVITEAALRTRKIGLGIMGWADMLAIMHIDYDSEEALELGDKVMATIQEAACIESRKLALEKGPYPALNDTVYKTDWIRNATLTCIAPTGSISVLASCSSGIEPHFSLEYTTYMGDRTPLYYKLPAFEGADSFIPKTALEINWDWHLRHQAVFQAHTDLAVSKTVNLPNGTTVETIRNIFLVAWKLRCKGTTIYREGSRELQAMEVGSETGIRQNVLPNDDYTALVHRFKVGDTKGYLHWGLSEKGDPMELFITASKQGSTTDGLLDAAAILMSISLQSGVPLEKLIDKMRGRRFEPAGLTGNPKIPTASSILDYIARYAQLRFLGTQSSYNPGMTCPECGAPVMNQEGCLVCSEYCGWSKC